MDLPGSKQYTEYPSREAEPAWCPEPGIEGIYHCGHRLPWPQEQGLLGTLKVAFWTVDRPGAEYPFRELPGPTVTAEAWFGQPAPFGRAKYDEASNLILSPGTSGVRRGLTQDWL